MSPKAAVTLNWQGRKAPSPPRTEALVTVKQGDSGCILIQEDNLLALAALARQEKRKFALAYLDPPFFTGREHARVERSKNPKTGRMARKLVPAFDDRWHSFEHYLGALLERVNLVYDLLEEDGCMILHVDPKTSHYAKVLCDEVFGSRCFASEIIWRYRRWPSKTSNFQRVHDVLLRYVKNPDKAPRFRQLYEPLAPSTLATWGDRKQRAVVSPKGQRLRSSTTAEKTKGTPLGDVWEIGIVAPVARERTGYPTQKPEALLERLIEACTHPGDWILDPYLGSGTTLSVALRLERRAVGIDRSLEAIHTTRSRLKNLAICASEQRLAARPLVHETAVASARAAS